MTTGSVAGPGSSQREAGNDTRELRSKSVREFRGQSFDDAITVCHQAREACPVHPGAREQLHWDHDDPSPVSGHDEQREVAFRGTLTAVADKCASFVTVARAARHRALTRVAG